MLNKVIRNKLEVWKTTFLRTIFDGKRTDELVLLTIWENGHNVFDKCAKTKMARSHSAYGGE